MAHQLDDLHCIAGHTKAQLCITDVHLKLQGDGQCRRCIASAVLALAHFTDQRLDRKGETESAATVVISRLPGPGRTALHESFDVLPDFLKARIPGADRPGILRIAQIHQRNAVAAVGVFAVGIEQRHVITRQVVLTAQTLGRLLELAGPVACVQLRKAGAQPSVFPQRSGTGQRLLVPDRGSLRIGQCNVVQKTVHTQIR